MNGQWLGSRAIRTNWATRKPPATKAERKFLNKYNTTIPKTIFLNKLQTKKSLQNRYQSFAHEQKHRFDYF